MALVDTNIATLFRAVRVGRAARIVCHMDWSSRSDSEVVAASLGGESDAFAAIIERYSASIRALVASFFRNRHQVDDIAQDTFVNAFFHLKSYRGEAPLAFWLKKIAVRLCYRELKRSARSEPLNTRSESDFGEEAGPAVLDAMLRGKVEDEATRLDQRLLLEKLLSRLGAAERLVLQLAVIEGRSIKEIVELTGWTRANVKVRAFRARRALKREFLAATARRESRKEKR